MSAALRETQHLIGREHLMQGNYLTALETFQSTLAKYGPHVGLLSDITTCFYLLGRVQECIQATKQLQEELFAARELLNDNNFVMTAIFLGKMLEEQGEVAGALDNYTQASIRASHSRHLRTKAQAQLLRLRSFLGLHTDLHALYQICLQSRVMHKRIDIELEHALMVAELELFDSKIALKRLAALFEKENLTSMDQRLLVVEFLEHLLLHQEPIHELRPYIDVLSVDELEVFEKMILMSSRSGFEVSTHGLNQAAKEVPLLSFLRILFLNLKISKSSDQLPALQEKFTFLLDSVSEESCKMLTRKWHLAAD